MPQLIVDYSPSRDILTRAAPLLYLVVVAELSFVVATARPLWIRFAVCLGVVAVSLLGWVVGNRLRGRSAFADVPRFGVVEVAVFARFGAVLTWLRLPSQVEELGEFANWEEVHRECGDAPCGKVAARRRSDPVDAIPLHSRERLNVTLLLFISQFVQALIVAALVTALYVGFGALTVSTATFEQWVGAAPTVLGPTVPMFGTDVYLSVELIKTAGFIGAIGGMQFLVTSLVDKDYQREFFGEVRSELRQVFAVRAVYRDRLGRVVAPAVSRGGRARRRDRAPARSSTG